MFDAGIFWHYMKPWLRGTETKRRRNLAKHGVDLAIAERFDFISAIIHEDDSETYGEQRQIAIGRIDDTIYVYVLPCWRRGPRH
jgi:uncharacterized DUF497 family protein